MLSLLKCRTVVTSDMISWGLPSSASLSSQSVPFALQFCPSGLIENVACWVCWESLEIKYFVDKCWGWEYQLHSDFWHDFLQSTTILKSWQWVIALGDKTSHAMKKQHRTYYLTLMIPEDLWSSCLYWAPLVFPFSSELSTVTLAGLMSLIQRKPTPAKAGLLAPLWHWVTQFEAKKKGF